MENEIMRIKIQMSRVNIQILFKFILMKQFGAHP